MSGIVLEVLREIAGMEPEIFELPVAVLSRASDVAAGAFRLGEGARFETLPGTNFFLQS